VIGAKGAHQTAAFHQHHSDKRRHLPCVHGDALGFGEPGIRVDVAHDYRLAAQVRIAQRGAKAPERAVSGKRWDTACVLTPHNVLAVFEVGVTDSVHAQVFPQQARGHFLHVQRIAQRPDRIGEPEKERLLLLAPPQKFGQELHVCFAGSALGDIRQGAGKTHGPPAVRGPLENRLAPARDPPRLARVRTTDPELFFERARSSGIESRRHGTFDVLTIVGMQELKPLGQCHEA
jgi:hypothetical protein